MNSGQRYRPALSPVTSTGLSSPPLALTENNRIPPSPPAAMRIVSLSPPVRPRDGPGRGAMISGPPRVIRLFMRPPLVGSPNDLESAGQNAPLVRDKGPRIRRKGNG